jgi:Straboviridae polynucleotide kinase
MNNILNIKILSGIPGCGKSTWSYNYIKDNPNTKRINRDDLRKMLDNNKSTEGNENFIKVVKLELIRLSLEHDRHIVLDDTHCYNDYLVSLIDSIRTIAKDLDKNIQIDLVDFDISMKTVMKRNKKRKSKIDNKVIGYMFNEKKNIDVTELDINNYIIVK